MRVRYTPPHNVLGRGSYFTEDQDTSYDPFPSWSEQTSRELPQPGEKWRHFKGGEYVVIAIAHLDEESFNRVVYSKTPRGVMGLTEYWQVFDTESDSVFWLSRSKCWNERLSVFFLAERSAKWEESQVNDRTLWARPLDNFMGIVSSPHGTESSNCYRFERISQSPTPVL
jgi:hypothetical protein